jgi:hypothetical protein
MGQQLRTRLKRKRRRRYLKRAKAIARTRKAAKGAAKPVEEEAAKKAPKKAAPRKAAPKKKARKSAEPAPAIIGSELAVPAEGGEPTPPAGE